MAAVRSGSSAELGSTGFSYAQAAKGQAPATKGGAASGSATPSTELASGSNWADDADGNSAENTASTKSTESQTSSREASERNNVTNGESKTASTASSVTSPDMGASMTSSNKGEDASSTPATSTETTWEDKPQASGSTSKPRKGKGRKDGSASNDEAKAPAPKPVLHEAPLPTVNIWQQRAKTIKPRAVPSQGNAAPSEGPVRKDVEKTKVEAQRKTAVGTQDTEQAGTTSRDWRKSSGNPAKSRDDARSNHYRQGSKSEQRPAPPAANNDVSWPTPEIAIEEDKRKAIEREEKAGKDRTVTPAAKAGKPEWKTMAYTPSAVFETTLPSRPGRGGRAANRGGSSLGGRGGLQGSSHGGSGEKPAARASSLPNGDAAVDHSESAKADREAMPPPAKPSRVPSDGMWRDAQNEHGRNGGGDMTNGSVDNAGHQSFARNFQAPRKNKSPVTSDNASTEAVTRRASTSSQAANGEHNHANGHDGASQRDTPNDRAPRDALPHREGKPKRGRGGNRGLGNGHASFSHQYPNGYPADHNGAGYGMNPSHPSFRGGHYSHGQQSRNAFRNPGMRSQSIPMDSFGRPAAGYPSYPMQTPEMQGFVPGGYYPGYPVYQPSIEVLSMVSQQLEYYFSVDNMVKDIYLRKHMDSQGFVFLGVIAEFNRLKSLTQDYELLRYVCLQSPNIEVRVGEDGKERLRKREDWERWVLDMKERDPSAQNEGPSQADRPAVPQLSMFEQPQFYPRGPQSAGLNGSFSKGDRGSQDVSYQLGMNGMSPAFYPGGAESPFGEFTEATRGRQVKSPNRDQNMGPMAHGMQSAEDADGQPDTFSSAQIEALTVVTHRPSAGPSKTPYHTAGTRTFSDGSIDSRSIFEDMQKSETDAQPQVNGESVHNGDSNTHSSDAAQAAEDLAVFWVKDKDAPVNKLPNGSTHESYVHLRGKALEQRQSAATGTCPYDMDVLFQFWSHFLIRNFNSQMYAEFRDLAIQDATQRHNNTGLGNLLKYYEVSLASQNTIRDRIARDYVELAKSEGFKSERPALKQLQAAWRNGALNIKNRKKLSDLLDATLRSEIES